jgi:hypothetical protein
VANAVVGIEDKMNKNLMIERFFSASQRLGFGI